MPGALVVPLLILFEYVNLHCHWMLVNLWLGVEAKAWPDWLGRGSKEGWSQYWRCPRVEGTLASLLLLASLELICHPVVDNKL